uniref:Putative secreted protein n=1 Tax=Anopheles darlingi TaxID=43151 RepID=A0A2M4D5R2_ANODA
MILVLLDLLRRGRGWQTMLGVGFAGFGCCAPLNPVIPLWLKHILAAASPFWDGPSSILVKRNENPLRHVVWSTFGANSGVCLWCRNHLPSFHGTIFLLNFSRAPEQRFCCIPNIGPS